MRAFELTQQFTVSIGRGMARFITDRFAEQDPLAAFELSQRLEPGRDRQNLRLAAARAYGEHDPDAALEWLGSFTPTPRDLLANVVQGIAKADPLRGIDLIEAQSLHPYSAGFFTLLSRPGEREQNANSQIADRMLAIHDDRMREEWIGALTQQWSFIDPDAALDWLIVNNDRVSITAYHNVARQLGERDPEAALLRTVELPRGVQDAWVSAVVGSFARNDAVSAIDWILQYRGSLVYDAGAAAIARAAAYEDPPQAARLFDTLSETKQIEIVEELAKNWSQRDVTAAHTWVERLARGVVRDGALAGFVESLGDRVPTAQTLALFSSDEVRQLAVLGAITRIAASDVEAARYLADEYLTDAELRRQAEPFVLWSEQ